jgi:hypothetical protein
MDALRWPFVVIVRVILILNNELEEEKKKIIKKNHTDALLQWSWSSLSNVEVEERADVEHTT